MPVNEQIIQQTKKWITDVVIGCNFCPFAAREIRRDAVLFEVASKPDKQSVLEQLAAIFEKLKSDESTETALLLLPSGYSAFTVYLSLVEISEALLTEEGLEGIFQLASFHPAYLFAGSTNDDPSNYSNRSPYPMLHILRESSVTRAVDSYPGVDDIPQKNIDFMQEKGLSYMQALRQACLDAF